HRSNFEAAQPPILIDSGVAILENEKIERHIMKNIPGGHNLFIPDQDVSRNIENVYSKFKHMLMKRDEHSAKAMTAILVKVDEMLKNKGTRFLTGDTMCCFDCELMPKLRHLQFVLGSFFCDYEIPAKLTHLWKYIKEMYQLDAFTQSNPADQDIINVYKNQQGVRSKNHEELETPSYTTSVPAAIAN
ncbi:chloride intracellular channel exc-4, partial [Eurytemora carolleeae]|uniref:chloride intracellular channel exc-4 n=1 Tax=Eurytemora carolleeae TaxID=1294199 RepID=UPI000C790233